MCMVERSAHELEGINSEGIKVDVGDVETRCVEIVEDSKSSITCYRPWRRVYGW